jgi:hypothetical protein
MGGLSGTKTGPAFGLGIMIVGFAGELGGWGTESVVGSWSIFEGT